MNLLDDTPIVPGDTHPVFEGAEAARQVLNDAETQLRHWSRSISPIPSSAGKIGANAMPGNQDSLEQPSQQTMDAAQQRVEDRERAQEEGREPEVRPPYPASETTTATAA